MKQLNKILILVFSSIVLYGCTSDFEETNTNPNKLTVGSVQAYNMFEPILYDSGNDWLYNTWFWNDELIQFTAFTGGTTRQEHRYFISNNDWQGMWNLYADYGSNTMHMYRLAVEHGDYSLQAVALTMKVLFMSNLTDMFGDIPYSQAFNVSVDGTTKPVFDTQKEVYQEMFAELEKADSIYATNPTFVKPALDGMYGGNMAKWQKFNNSLYLRLLCRVSGRSSMNVGAKMTEILNNPVKYPIFTSNDDNATVNYSGLAPYRNEFADDTEGDFTSGGRKLTQQLIKMTVVTDAGGNQTYVDPRLPIYGKINPGRTVWKGTVAGCTEEQQGTVDAGTSWLNTPVFCRAAAPSTYMDYAEVQFILAEAALKGYISGGEDAAKAYYENAVTASLKKWSALGLYSATSVTISDSDVATFLSSDLASWDNATNKAELIADQKYLALFWIGMEAYHEYRRTGYPVLTIGDGTYNDHVLPTRFAYPNTTIATNQANAQAAIQDMGGTNDMKTPVWWSQQAIDKGNN